MAFTGDNVTDYAIANELLEYREGKLFWRVSRRYNTEGQEAGCEDGRYRTVVVNRKLYKVHRVVWLLVKGIWPTGHIDHINGDTRDNRIENLRDVDNLTNSQNQRKPVSNTSGTLGVAWNQQKSKWTAYISVEGKRVFLGNFVLLDDAVAARKQADVTYGFHTNHGR